MEIGMIREIYEQERPFVFREEMIHLHLHHGSAFLKGLQRENSLQGKDLKSLRNNTQDNSFRGKNMFGGSSEGII